MAKSEYWFKMAEEDLKDASLDIDKIIMPSEIYDANKANALFMNAKEVMELGRKILKEFK